MKGGMEAKSEKGRIILVISPPEKYKTHIIDKAREMAGKHKKLCYMAMNAPHAEVLEKLKDVGKERLFFIEPQAKPGSGANDPNVEYVQSASALSGISTAINNAMDEKKCDSFILDSLTDMLGYNDKISIIRLVQFLTEKLRAKKCEGVITLLDNEELYGLVKDIEMFVDKVVYFGKKQA